MYRRVLPLLLTAVLLLSGCAAGQKNMPQKTDEKEMTGQPSDMSGEGSMYMDTTENVIYLAGFDHGLIILFLSHETFRLLDILADLIPSAWDVASCHINPSVCVF